MSIKELIKRLLNQPTQEVEVVVMQEEKKLKCKMSTFTSPLTFNEWAVMYRVGSMYKEPTPFFQGNVRPCEIKEETPYQGLVNLLLK